jgi:magnesium transporter
VIGGCLLVSIVGNAVPFLFHRWRIDPRIAAGPVVLSLSDFLTLLVYLAIVKALAA